MGFQLGTTYRETAGSRKGVLVVPLHVVDADFPAGACCGLPRRACLLVMIWPLQGAVTGRVGVPQPVMDEA
jgi:hypothetical protein